MEAMILPALSALLVLVVFRVLLKPLKWVLRTALWGLCGFGCLWLLNTASGFTGILLPVNPVTVLLSGMLGLPGVALVALLAVA